MTTRTWPPALAAALALVLSAAACGSSTPETSAEVEAGATTGATSATTSATGDGPTTTRRSLPDRASSTDHTAPTTAGAGATTTASTVDPGSPIEFAPAAGTQLAVVGVQWDDTLNFRSGPGVENPVVAEVASLEPAIIVATGEAWQFPGSIWWEVEMGGDQLWASQSFLGMLGAEIDMTASFAGSTGVTTLEAVADSVVATLDDTEGEIRFRHVVEPLMFEVGGTAIIDVLGYPDDAVKGARLTIDVEPEWDETGDEPVIVDLTITAVHSIPICSRAVSAGLCV